MSAEFHCGSWVNRAFETSSSDQEKPKGMIKGTTHAWQFEYSLNDRYCMKIQYTEQQYNAFEDQYIQNIEDLCFFGWGRWGSNLKVVPFVSNHMQNFLRPNSGLSLENECIKTRTQNTVRNQYSKRYKTSKNPSMCKYTPWTSTVSIHFAFWNRSVINCIKRQA